jgi:hypothetical protein
VADPWLGTEGPASPCLAWPLPALGLRQGWVGEPAACLQMIKELAAVSWSREAPASKAQSSLFLFWHQTGLLMFISPCLLFLTLFRMFLPTGESEAGQWGQRGAGTLNLGLTSTQNVCQSWKAHSSASPVTSLTERGSDLPNTMGKVGAEV